MCESLCVFVDRWPKKGSYLLHFLPASDCLEGPFSLFWHEDHKELCPCEPARPEEGTKDAGSLELDSEEESRIFKPRTWV